MVASEAPSALRTTRARPPRLAGAHADALERGLAPGVCGLAGRGLDGALEDDGQLVVVQHLVPGTALDDDVLYLGGGEAPVKRFG